MVGGRRVALGVMAETVCDNGLMATPPGNNDSSNDRVTFLFTTKAEYSVCFNERGGERVSITTR